jgi:dienelactone hydrolase
MNRARSVLAVVVAVVVGLLAATGVAEAKLHTELVEYKDGETVLEGYLAWDDASAERRPGVLVVHDWMGLGADAKKRADMLAELGYVAFAADIYGKGVRPKDAKEASAQAGHWKSDRPALRKRVRVAFDVLAANKLVDKARTAAIGYCFGGTTALELARSGAPVAATVTFHGGLDSPTPADAKHITGKVLALHGGDDPFVPPEQVLGFEKEMRDAGVDWQLVAYGGAVHSFTVKAAGNDNSKGAAYNERADRRSWEAMKQFFAEVLAKK